MNKIALIFLSCIFFFVLFLYLSNTLSPFDSYKISQIVDQKDFNTNTELYTYILSLKSKGLVWQLLDFKNLTLITSVFSATFLTGFVSIYSFIDKFFFKSYHQNPEILIPLRRGLIILLFILSSFILSLLQGATWYNLFAIFILCLIIELIFIKISLKKMS